MIRESCVHFAGEEKPGIIERPKETVQQQQYHLHYEYEFRISKRKCQESDERAETHGGIFSKLSALLLWYKKMECCEPAIDGRGVHLILLHNFSEDSQRVRRRVSGRPAAASAARARRCSHQRRAVNR